MSYTPCVQQMTHEQNVPAVSFMTSSICDVGGTALLQEHGGKSTVMPSCRTYAVYHDPEIVLNPDWSEVVAEFDLA